MNEHEYQQSVMDDFKKRGFTLSSFKGSNDWQEVLDPSWDWKTFDYKIPDYNHGKSINDIMDEDTGNAINNIDHFVRNNP